MNNAIYDRTMENIRNGVDVRLVNNEKDYLKWPGQFPGIAENAGNHGNDKKSHKSHQILNQTNRNVNQLCLGKISRHETVRTKFSVDSGFSNELYG